MRPLLLAAAVGTLVAGLGACSKLVFLTSGEATSNLWPQIYVESYPDGTTDVTVIMGTNVIPGMQMDNGDALSIALNGGAAVAMTPATSFYGNLGYTASFTGASPGDQLVLAYTRTTKKSAPNTVITIPSGFTLSSPANNTPYQDGDQVHVAWTPGSPTDRVEARIEVTTCTKASPAQVADINQRYDAPEFAYASDGSIDLRSGTTASAGDCSVQVLAGNATGTISLDPAFGGLDYNSASVRLATPRSVTFSP